MRALDRTDFLVIALFQARLDDVSRAAGDILAAHFVRGRFDTHWDRIDVRRIYERRPPAGGAHAIRAVFFEPGTTPGTTAFIANLEDGWLTMCNAICLRIAGRHVLMRSCENDDYPLNDLEVWVDGTSVRHVAAAKEDPSWEFTSRGQPMEFEDTRYYTRRAIGDRINRTVLVEYAAKMGWHLDSPAFWQSDVPALYLSENVQLRT
jgi:hypothetical protein